MREIMFFIYLVPYQHSVTQELEKSAVLWGTTADGKHIAYALVNSKLADNLRDNYGLMPHTLTPYIGTWRYHNSVVWDEKSWNNLWAKLGPFKTTP